MSDLMIAQERAREERGDETVTRILVADDQRDVIEALRLFLKSQGYQLEAANSPAAVLNAIESRQFDVLLIDLNYTRDTTSGAEGLDLLATIHAFDNTLPVVVMTAWGSIELVVEAMRRGARDFVQKPWDNARLLTVLRTQVELGRALRRSHRLESENSLLREEGKPVLISESPRMQRIVNMIEKIGPSDANVLITGENGSGKGVVARALHAASKRAHRPLVSVNIGGFAEGVFESEVFGHVRGAFTDAKSDRAGRFEVADGGTLFLDEIANLTPMQQAKLLRVLETGEFERVGSSQTRHADVRLLSATNANLSDEVESGRFRQDLFFRLRTIEIHLPPLRERREDIAPLAGHFLLQHSRRYRKSIDGFEPSAMEQLLRYDWPGNVRELDHAIERAVLMAGGRLLGSGDLALSPPASSEARQAELSLEEVERLLIRKALERSNGNVTDAAKSLGLSRSALYRRIQKHGV